jgi:hypothetical protein
MGATSPARRGAERRNKLLPHKDTEGTSSYRKEMRDLMTIIRGFIKRRPLLSYVALTFAISWGGFLIVAGPGGILRSISLSAPITMHIPTTPMGPRILRSNVTKEG